MERIEIDWDIHKLIEAERRGFGEAPYIALRRLLKLPEEAKHQLTSIKHGSGIPWSEEGVIVPHGSEARMEYQRGEQVYEGHFLDGQLVVNGRSFPTLSAAAIALAVTKNGTKTNLNGWNYWRARFPGEKHWRSLAELRSKR